MLNINSTMLIGFSIPIGNKFLKQQTSTFKLTKPKLFTIPKLTCTQFAHSFKKDIVEVQKCFHVFNER
jgi:hypothetical protein